MRHLRECLETYQRGDRLDDDELEALATEMKTLADVSYQFGDVFRLQAAYADRVSRDCLDFMRSRTARKKVAQREALP